MQRGGGEVLDFCEANAAGRAVGDFDRAGDKHFALGRATAATRDRIVLGAQGDFCPVDLGDPSQERAGKARSWPAAAWRTAATPTYRSPAQAASAIAAPKFRWSGWPSDRRPPVHKQIRFVPGHSFEKATRTDRLCGKAFELPHHPRSKCLIDISKYGFEHRRRVSPIVCDPPPQERIDLPSDISHGQLCSMAKPKFPDRRPHGLHRRTLRE